MSDKNKDQSDCCCRLACSCLHQAMNRSGADMNWRARFIKVAFAKANHPTQKKFRHRAWRAAVARRLRRWRPPFWSVTMKPVKEGSALRGAGLLSGTAPSPRGFTINRSFSTKGLEDDSIRNLPLSRIRHRADAFVVGMVCGHLPHAFRSAPHAI